METRFPNSFPLREQSLENTCAPDYQTGLGRERKGAVSINRRRRIGETEHYVEKREEGTRFGYVFKCVRGAIRLPRFGFQGPVAVHPEYAHKFIIEVLFIEASMAGHLNMKRRSPGEWCPLPKEERDSRHCPRVRARAMAAFDYLIDSEYSGGPGTGGDLSLFNFLQISADGEGTGGGGHRLRCEHVSCVCACV